MTKFILIVCAVLLVYMLVKNVRRKGRSTETTSTIDAGEDMVRCVQCGINLPRSESIMTQGHYYCCAEHQRQHQVN